MQSSTRAAAGRRRAVSAVGQLLFHDLQQRQQALIAQAFEANAATVPALDALLARIENEPSWFDADRLAFKEFLTELAARYGQSQSLAGLKLGRPGAQVDRRARARPGRQGAARHRPVHDIHGRAAQALPTVLDQLVADGYRFATWRDGQFVVSAPKRAAPDAGVASAGDTLYRESHALVIGIDQYARWPGLHHAVRDAKAIQDMLVARFGFKPENVTALFDGEATRANILRTLNDKLTDPKRVKRDDRVMVFFAGHGSTRRLASGREVATSCRSTPA